MPGEFYEKARTEKVDLKAILTLLDTVEDKLDALVVFMGETTAPGAADGSTLVCYDLTSKPDYDGSTVVILSGSYLGQSSGINGATTGGTVVADTPFDGQILDGVRFAIVSIKTAAVAIDAIVAFLNAIEAKLDDGTFGLAALKALIDALEAKLDREPTSKKEGITTIPAATDFTTLQTIIDELTTTPRHVGDVFIDLNMNGDASAFHNRATLGDILTFQIEVSFDGVSYEYVDSNTITASATAKVGIVIKDFHPVSKWRIRMKVDNDRGEYKFAWMYGGQ